MSLTLGNLNNCFNAAYNEEANYVAVVVSIKGQDSFETIINSSSSFPSKQKYYNEAYNEDLTHKHADGIRIVGFTYGDSYAAIEYDLFGPPEDAPEINDDEVAKFVSEKTGIDEITVLKVLSSQLDYYEEIGIATKEGEEE